MLQKSSSHTVHFAFHFKWIIVWHKTIIRGKYWKEYKGVKKLQIQNLFFICYNHHSVQSLTVYAFIFLRIRTFLMALVLTYDALYPLQSLHNVRELSFAVCTNVILILITSFFHHISLDICWFRTCLLLLCAVSCLPFWNIFHCFKNSSNFCSCREYVFSSAQLFVWPHFDLFFFLNHPGDISSGNTKLVGASSMWLEVEGVGFDVLLWTQSEVTSKLQIEFENVRVVVSVCDSNSPSLGFPSAVAS